MPDRAVASMLGRYLRLPLLLAICLLLAACAADEPEDDAAEADPAEEEAAVDEPEDAEEEPEEVPDVDFPARTIELIVPFGEGGATDTVARIYASVLEDELDASVTVDNRPGASGSIGISDVIASDPDGHVIGVGSNSTLVLQPLVNPDVTYSGEDFDPIMKLVDNPPVIAVQDDAPWADLEEFIEDARERPGEIRVSTAGALTQNDVVVHILNQEADIELSNVPFSEGGAEATAALLAGTVEATAAFGPGILGQVEAGELRVLGVVADDEFDMFPDATPFVELGYQVNQPLSNFVVAPVGLPDEVRDILIDASRTVVNSDAFAEAAADQGLVVAPSEPDDIREELAGQSEVYEGLLEAIQDVEEQ